jgi:hypothetical protein
MKGLAFQPFHRLLPGSEAIFAATTTVMLPRSSLLSEIDAGDDRT